MHLKGSIDIGLFEIRAGRPPIHKLSWIEPRAVAVSLYGWLKTSYGWLAGRKPRLAG